MGTYIFLAIMFKWHMIKLFILLIECALEIMSGPESNDSAEEVMLHSDLFIKLCNV